MITASSSVVKVMNALEMGTWFNSQSLSNQDVSEVHFLFPSFPFTAL